MLVAPVILDVPVELIAYSKVLTRGVLGEDGYDETHDFFFSDGQRLRLDYEWVYNPTSHPEYGTTVHHSLEYKDPAEEHMAGTYEFEKNALVYATEHKDDDYNHTLHDIDGNIFVQWTRYGEGEPMYPDGSIVYNALDKLIYIDNALD